MDYQKALTHLETLLDSTDYFNKYPSRYYNKEVLKSNKTTEEKVRWLLRDGLIQTELYGKTLSSIDMHAEPVEYFKTHINLT